MKVEEIEYLPLENVESEHCALIVNNGIDKIDEIQEHWVELNNKRAVIKSRNLESAIPMAVKTIRDLGYQVTTVKKHFPILNMSCASCANSTQSILEMQKGVVLASVNFANNSALIEFIPTITNAQNLKAALQLAGYDLVIQDESSGQETLEELNSKSYRKLKNKTIGAVSFSIPLAVMAMVPYFMNLPNINYLMWLLSTPVVLYYGKQFFVGAYKQLRHGSSNMDTLVALSTGVAYIISIFNTLYPEFWHQKGLHAHVYFETSSVVISFILLGKLLEEKAKGNTSTALKKLIGLQPKSVTLLLENGQQVQSQVTDVKNGDVLLIKPGEKIAVDGIVTEGESYVDESMISGEPLPVEKIKDSEVFAGTINQKGSFLFKAEKVGDKTLLAQIIKMVQDAQGSRAPVQKLVDKIAGIFVPSVIGISILSLIAWWIFGGEQGITRGLLAMVTVLIIACPCALGLATPTAIMVGIGKGAGSGILIKDAESLELAKNINAIVLDKTGTITEGKPTVTDIKWTEFSDKDSQHILYTIEKSSEHPLADSIVTFLQNNSKFLNSIKIENIEGKGIKGNYSDKNFYVGNENLLNDNNISINNSLRTWTDEKLIKANTVVFFTDEVHVLATIAISDKIKESSAIAVSNLQSLGIDIYMLTGDNNQTASAVARQTGIKNFQANVLPAQKSDFIKKLQNEGKVVAMVGDGINDSAALAQADVSIAMGKGSDIAIDVAKMTIISNDLHKISQAIKLSKNTVSTINQNLFWAFIYNIIGIPIAAGILYPINGFLLNPMIAGAAMALSSVSVVANSLLLKIKK